MSELSENERILTCAKGLISTVDKLPSLRQSNPMLIKFSEEIVRLNDEIKRLKMLLYTGGIK